MNPRTRRYMIAALYHLIGMGAAIAILALLSRFEITICPLKWILDAGCPFCGMTRAHLAALSLDFESAFAYHPLFPGAIPLLWFCAHEFLFRTRGLRVLWHITVWGLIAGFVAVYALRLFGAIPVV